MLGPLVRSQSISSGAEEDKIVHENLIIVVANSGLKEYLAFRFNVNNR